MLALASIGALSMSPAAAVAGNRRQLSYTSILNYNTGSEVTDHANIDLDQKALEAALSSNYDWATASAIYSNGAYSKPTAVCTLTTGTTAGAAIAKKDPVTFTTSNGDSASGKAYADYDAAATEILFTYPVSELRVQPPTTACYVGGLPTADQSTDGCVAGSAGTDPSSGDAAGTSTFTIGTTTYTGTCVNKGKRTLKGFSTKAQKYMYDCPAGTAEYASGCPYTSYKPYYDYYGQYDYGNVIVTAALDKTTISGFTNGGFDLSAAPDTARKEFVKKGTAYMNDWMYTIREFEDAIDDCTAGDLTSNAMSSGPVHAWDEGVAFYVGSLLTYDDLLAGNLPTLDAKGKLVYTLANKRCKNFNTCGPDGVSGVGEAKANIDLFQLFVLGQYELLAGNCAKVVPIKDDIVKKMTVPLVQGTLRYAYKVDKLQGSDKEKAEGGVFAAAVLPQLHACDPAAAQTVFSNMGWGTASTDFMAVKAAFEGCYEKMGITCADVGGLWNKATSDYYSDGDASAAPCVDASSSGGMNDTSVIMIIVAAAVFVICLLIVCFMYSSEKKGKPIFKPAGAVSGSA